MAMPPAPTEGPRLLNVKGLVAELAAAPNLTEIAYIRALTLEQVGSNLLQQDNVNELCDEAVQQIKDGRGERSNPTQEQETT